MEWFSGREYSVAVSENQEFTSDEVQRDEQRQILNPIKFETLEDGGKVSKLSNQVYYQGEVLQNLLVDGHV